MNRIFSPSAGLLAAVLTSALYAAPAAADTYAVPLLTSAAPYSQSVSHLPSSFVDFFNFSLAHDANVSGAVVSLQLNLGSLNLFNIDNLALSLFDSSNSLLASGTTSLNLYDIDPGSYYVRVSGDANGSAGGQYLFGLAVQAVPEPEQWMLLVAGLLTVGSMVRRRSFF